jgi:hypothetical protein
MTPLTPMLVLTGAAYGNDVYEAGFTASSFMNIKPLLYGGVATVLLELVAAIPGAEPVATAIGWAALLGYLLAGPTISNLTKIGK